MTKDIWSYDEIATQHFGHPDKSSSERQHHGEAVSEMMCRLLVFAGMVSAAVLAFSIDMMLLP